MSKLMAALFPEGRRSLVAAEAAGEVEGCLAALLAEPHASELMAAQAAAEDGFWPEPGSWMNSYRPYVVRDGVLQIPVKGILLANLSFAVGSYATGYPYIRRAFQRGMADTGVKGIALLCDSPGGEVAGNFDLVDVLFAGRGVKPVRAFAHERAYSAAYSIASAADRIVVARTGGVGSIGVVTSHVDASGALAQAGVKITFVYAGAHKVDGNFTEPLPDDVKARMQARVDALMDVFVDTVARNRGLTPEAVRATEALTYTATEAIAARLADEMGSLDDAVAAFAADLDTTEEDESMITPEAHAAAIAAARLEGETSGKDSGAAAAQVRVKAILDSDEAKGRADLARHFAFDSTMPAEAAVAALAKAPKGGEAAGSGLDADMRREGRVDLGEGGGKGPADMTPAERGAAEAKALLGIR